MITMNETHDYNSQTYYQNDTNYYNKKQGLIFEENSQRNPMCNVCLKELNESIYRIVIFQDKEKNLIVKNFHFFFPCWDIEYICQEYFAYKIVNLGFSCEKTILKNHKKVRNLQRNLSLWV